MGTRFIATDECDSHADYKKAILDAREEDIVLTERITGVPLAVIRTPYVERIGTKAGPARPAPPQGADDEALDARLVLRPLVLAAEGRDPEGELDEGRLAGGEERRRDRRGPSRADVMSVRRRTAPRRRRPAGSAAAHNRRVSSSAATRSRLGVLAIVLLTAALAAARRAARRRRRRTSRSTSRRGVAQAAHGSWAVNVELPPAREGALGAGGRCGPGPSSRRPSRSAPSSSPRARSSSGRRRTRLKVLFAARLVTVGFLVALLLFAARAAGGGEAGLLAAALLAGQTALVPHGHLVTTDVPAAALIARRRLGGDRALREAAPPRASSRRRLARCGRDRDEADGARRSSRSCRSSLVPAIRQSRDPARARRFALVALAPPAAHGRRSSPLLLRPWTAGEPGLLPTLLSLYGLPDGDARLVTRLAERRRRGSGATPSRRSSSSARPRRGALSYFLGEVSTSPSPAYHLVALVVKSPLPWLLLVAAGLPRRLQSGRRSARDSSSSAGRRLPRGVARRSADRRPPPDPGDRSSSRPAAAVALGSVAPAGALRRRSRRRSSSPSRRSRSGARWGGTASSARFFLAPPARRLEPRLGAGPPAPRGARRRAADSRAPSLGVAYFGGDLPSFRIPGCVDLLASDAPLPRYVAVSRQLLLVGPQTRPLRGRPSAGGAGPRGAEGPRRGLRRPRGRLDRPLRASGAAVRAGRRAPESEGPRRARARGARSGLQRRPEGRRRGRSLRQERPRVVRHVVDHGGVGREGAAGRRRREEELGVADGCR